MLFQLQFYNQYHFDKSSLILELFTGKKTNLFTNILIPSETEIPFDFNYPPHIHKIQLAYLLKPTSDCIMNFDFSVERETHIHLRLGSFRHYNISNILIRNSLFEEKGLSSTKALLTLSFQNKLSDNISHRFFISLQKVSANNPLVLEFYKRIPSYKFNYLISFAPSRDFILSALINFQKETKWYEFQRINEYQILTEEPTLSDKISNSVLLNVSAQKSFWKDRLKINASIFNLLNNDIQYHPLGSVMKLIFYLKGEFAI